MASVNGIRTTLYVFLVRLLLPVCVASYVDSPGQWLFAAVLLGLSAQRLHYTTHLPLGDPLNEGKHFYGTRQQNILSSL